MLRVLVAEWITGGGCLAQPLPASLMAEGRAMADSLVADLAPLADVQVRATRDPRLPAVASLAETVWLDRRDDLLQILPSLIGPGELFWPVAPETDGALEALVRAGLAAGARAVASDPATIAITASKLETARRLAAAGVPVAPTMGSAEPLPESASGWVVKPDDGAGSVAARHVRSPRALAVAIAETPLPVLQPWIEGEPLSMTLLCAAGAARLLTCNRQRILETADGTLRFDGVVVAGAECHRPALAPLATTIAAALPGLFGLVGVDLVLGAAGPVLLEVNARLTTAYPGLRRALGVNPAALAMALLGPDQEVLARSCPLPARAVPVMLKAMHA